MTKRLGLLLGSLVAFAACGGGGGGNNNNTCGDGVVGGSETCDDGNTSSGDGCSATCKTESSGTCGNGTVDVNDGEQCDDNNTTNGDGCSSTCQNEIPVGCGNGTLDNGEECDDHNNTSGDGCSATCHNEGAAGAGTCASPFTVVLVDDAASGGKVGHAMGDTTASTDQVMMTTCSGESDAGGGNDHQYKIVLAARADLLISNTDQDATGTDLVLRLSTTVCDSASEIVDNAGHDGCSDDDPEFLGYRGLAAGTYFLDVDGYSDTDNGTYDVEIDVLPSTCGNGTLDAGEECDDGDSDNLDGCSSRCLVEDGYVCNADEPSVCALNVCGDGTIGGTEECDDLNTTNGDGCNSMCNLEYDVSEAEPNDTTPQVLAAGNHRIKGSLATGDDVDLYTFTLATAAHVEIETYTTIEANRPYTGNGDDRYDCQGTADTGLALFDNGDPATDLTDLMTAKWYDSDDGALNDGPNGYGCSYIGTNDTDMDATQGDLPAGTYTIEIGEEGGNALARYLVAINITTGTTPPPAAGLVINEYMANDNDADTNCDGVHPTGSDTTDEFVEIVNTGAASVDLTGMTLSDGAAVRHTFKASDTTGSMTLAAGKAVVVWGGGAPNCPGVTNWFVANSAQHTLGLNNTGGDTITLKSAGATPTILAQTSYTVKPTLGVSANLNPDLTGTAYVLHNAVTGHVGNFSPGKKSDGTAF
ncbi:MAG TPA: DUF4215 domain-containing protein [Kofleriaceae bacterium]|jgi:cysteine-rich repeat protein